MYNSILETFICVADCGSMSKAAEKLYISTTAVMKQMNLLETHLQLPLLERTNHGIRLTECGESIYKDAKFIISYSNNAIEKAKKIAGNSASVIRVGTSMLNPCKVFMDLWYQINDRFPQFKIQIVPFEDDHEGILSVIENIGVKYDFIVGVCDSQKWLERCNMYRLGRYKKCVAVPARHRLASKKKLDISDLYGETLMMVKKGDSPENDYIRKELTTNHPQIQIEDTDHYYDISVFNRCEQSGNVLLNIECWKDIHPSLISIPVDWDYSIAYGLMYPLNPSQEIVEFLNVLKAVYPQ